MPVAGPNEIVVRVVAAAICHTDFYIVEGTHPSVSYPIVPGHEFSGIVEQAGPQANGLREGDRVAVQTLLGCGRCGECQRGEPGFCPTHDELGRTIDGGWQQFVKIPAYAGHKLPDRFSLLEAALTEPSANAYAAVRRGAVDVTDSVVVIGPGPIGLLALQYARLRNPRQLLLVGTERDAIRLELGRRLGAHHSVTNTSADQAVLELTEGRGADVVLQCAGTVEATRLALRLAAERGRVVIEGFAASAEEVGISPDRLVTKQLSVHGVRGWTIDDFTRALELNARGAIQLRPLITHEYALHDFKAALSSGHTYETAVKVAFVPQDGGVTMT